MELPVSKPAGISKCMMLVSSYHAWATTAHSQCALEVCHTLTYSTNILLGGRQVTGEDEVTRLEKLACSRCQGCPWF